jgi:hypothetical protein
MHALSLLNRIKFWNIHEHVSYHVLCSRYYLKLVTKVFTTGHMLKVIGESYVLVTDITSPRTISSSIRIR